MKNCLNRRTDIQNYKTRLPEWFKQEIPEAASLEEARKLPEEVDTICAQARCPNRNYCSSRGHLTFLILGPVCSRSCRFCSVLKSKNRAAVPDKDEPQKVALAAKRLKSAYAVITSVCRDDLEDGGAKQFALTVEAVRQECPQTVIELLIPDFQGRKDSLNAVVRCAPDVIGHNLETVSRLCPRLRPEADYRRSLEVLSELKSLNGSMVTKSSLMLGFSEKEDELAQAMKDLRKSDCDILTLGQYLAPSSSHEPVSEYIRPEKFSFYGDLAKELGFKAVLSGPLVRSSFQAEDVYRQVRLRK